MKFQFDYRTRVSDLWQLSMYYAYSSYLAVINVICIISSIVLLIKYYKTAEWLGCLLMILFVLLFTFIQPVLIWNRARRHISGHEQNLSLTFSDKGMKIFCDGKEQTKSWNEIRYLVKPTLVAIYVGKTEGYILTNRVLKNERKAFISYIKQQKR